MSSIHEESGHDAASEDMATRSGAAGPPSTALPKCFCNWKFCRTYQKAFREFRHPFYNGVIKLKFYENDPKSMALKASIDRTLNVESTKRNDWKETPGSVPADSNKYCRYYVARHHFTEPLMRHYLNDRRSWDWNEPLTAETADQFLYSADPKDIYDDGEGNGEPRYVQTPNVPKDHVRELLRRLKDSRTESQRNNGVDTIPVTPSQSQRTVPLASQDEHAPNIHQNNEQDPSPTPGTNHMQEHVQSSHSRFSTSTKNSNQTNKHKRNGNNSTSTDKTGRSTVTKASNEQIMIESDDYAESDEEEYGDDNDLDDTNRYSTGSRSRKNGAEKRKQAKEDDSSASTVALLAQKEEENHRLREDLNDCKKQINMLQNIVEKLKVRLDLDDTEGDNGVPAVNGESNGGRKGRDGRSNRKSKNSAKSNMRKKGRNSFSSSGDDDDDVSLSDVKTKDREAAESSLEHDHRGDSSEEEATSRLYGYNTSHNGDFGGARRQNGNSRHNRQSLRRGSIHSRRSIHGGNSIVSRSRRHSRRGSMRGGADDGASVMSRQSLQSISVSIKSLPREIELMDDEDDNNAGMVKDDSSYFDDTRSVGSRSAGSRVSGRSFVSGRRTRNRKSQIRGGANAAANRQRKGRSGRGAVPQEIDLSGDELDNIDVTHENVSTDTLFVREKQIVDPYGEKGVYTGALSKSTCMPNGKGRLEYEKESRWYEGDWIHGRWTGYGKLSNGDGDFYEGGLKNDHKHGTGVMKFADGRLFEGEYIRGQMIQGKMTYQDGSIYGGSWVDGMRHGRGKCIFVDGSQYEGEFREGNFHGHGKMTWNDGGWYVGNWSNGEMDGRGKEVRPDGSLRHDGEWSGGQPIRSASDTRRRRQQQQMAAANGDEFS